MGSELSKRLTDLKDKNMGLTNVKNAPGSEYCGDLMRALICSSKEADCMKRYLNNMRWYECKLRNKKMSEDTYRRQYDPHYSINDKILEQSIKDRGKEYIYDKERRLFNFRYSGTLEPYAEDDERFHPSQLRKFCTKNCKSIYAKK